ncbi:MAG: Gfo/Idh/MocA family oxidoreductase [Kiritimatiellales bacterium]
MKNVVFIGGWGHWFEAANEFSVCSDVCFSGAAPAYAGEELSGVVNHPALAGIPVFNSADELFKNVAADIAVISTRPGNIAATVICAADAGCDVIAEKPVGITFDEVDAVETALKKNNVRLMAMFSMRADPVFQTAKRLVNEGAIGMPVLVNARKSYKFGDETKRPDWFGERAVYGGTFPWVGIHALDIIRFTTGLKMTQVAALQNNFIHPALPACEDSCAGLFMLSNGAPATVSIDYFRPASAGTHGDDWVRIVGTGGIIEARSNETSVTLLKDGKTPEPVELDIPAPLYLPFIENKNALTNTADALELTRAGLCARQSADEQKIININKQ